MAADGDPSSTPLSSTLPPRRVVLLGASNLTRGISTVVDTARRIWGGSAGSFCRTGSRPIVWPDEQRARPDSFPAFFNAVCGTRCPRLPPADTAALVTDVGNDILYGAPVASILDWVEECVERLEPTQRADRAHVAADGHGHGAIAVALHVHPHLRLSRLSIEPKRRIFPSGTARCRSARIGRAARAAHGAAAQRMVWLRSDSYSAAALADCVE